jgi:hypothetical protein
MCRTLDPSIAVEPGSEAVMKGRVLVAGIVAGVVSFLWGLLSHVVLDAGQSTMKSIPEEPAVLSAMSTHLKEPGFYFFPSMMDQSKGSLEQQKAAQAAYLKAYETRPHGVLIYSPPNGPLKFGTLLGKQLAIEIVCGLIAAWLLSMAAGALPGFGGRVLFVALLGLFASMSVDAPYWNWYGFPTAYFRSQLIEEVGGWALVGVVLAFMIRGPKRRA